MTVLTLRKPWDVHDPLRQKTGLLIESIVKICQCPELISKLVYKINEIEQIILDGKFVCFYWDRKEDFRLKSDTEFGTDDFEIQIDARDTHNIRLDWFE